MQKGILVRGEAEYPVNQNLGNGNLATWIAVINDKSIWQYFDYDKIPSYKGFDVVGVSKDLIDKIEETNELIQTGLPF